MPDKKLTDNEIVKDCKNCIRYTTCIFCIIGGRSISKDCNDFVELDTINSLQAENERLKGWQDLLKAEKHSLIKAEAYKEFAERLKDEIIGDTAYGCDTNQHTGYYDYQIKIGDIPEYIDNLLKELVGDNQ